MDPAFRCNRLAIFLDGSGLARTVEKAGFLAALDDQSDLVRAELSGAQ
jgi:hypothetical protein